MPIITLTTDFGSRDGYVAAMKGVIYSIARDATIVDISHDIAPQDLMEAAFVLRNAVPYFPEGSIHVIVVDPGVGTQRRAVAVRTSSMSFVAPDNGLLSLVLPEDSGEEMVELNNREVWRQSDTSATFHGRDIFAPAAAHLASGIEFRRLGSPIQNLTPMHWALPIADDSGIQGWIVHVDHFGNCITNVPRHLVHRTQGKRSVKCYAGNVILKEIRSTYGTVAAGEPIAIYNSNDQLEIAVNQGNAAGLLNLKKGSPVNLVFGSERSSGY